MEAKFKPGIWKEHISSLIQRGKITWDPIKNCSPDLESALLKKNKIIASLGSGTYMVAPLKNSHVHICEAGMRHSRDKSYSLGNAANIQIPV